MKDPPLRSAGLFDVRKQETGDFAEQAKWLGEEQKTQQPRIFWNVRIMPLGVFERASKKDLGFRLGAEIVGAGAC